MDCHCIEIIETGLIDKGIQGKKVTKATISNIEPSLNTMFTNIDIEFQIKGIKCPAKVDILFSYCPFCGKKISNDN